MKVKEIIAFTVFMAAAFFYNLLPVTCSVLLLVTLAGLYRMAAKSEREGGEDHARNGKRRVLKSDLLMRKKLRSRHKPAERTSI